MGRDEIRKRMRTTRDLVLRYRGHILYDEWRDWEGVELHIPARHPVVGLPMGTPPGWHYVSDAPWQLLDPKTQGMLLHDAAYYGIPIPADAVEEVKS